MDTASQMHVQIPEETLEIITSGLEYHDKHHWIPWAWAAISREGDLEPIVDESSPDDASQLITLAALGHLYDKFQDAYTGLHPRDEFLTELLGDARPAINQIELARYCERNGHYDYSEIPESAAALEHVAVNNRTNEVQVRLVHLVGQARLFTSLVVAGTAIATADFGAEDDDAEFIPLGDSLTLDAFDPYLDDVLNFTLTAEKHRAYEWLTGDLDLG
ncbi:hypothetical protein [Arthrobacter sp. AOP36-C1-22]|uniref:hypothetical protein n=1 Tax=Arthrobacter sp. AOP36-C1-22 TaxID=3457683 RepID=UPI004033DBE8